MASKIGQLDVHVCGTIAGLLSKADQWNFTYQKGAAADVALSMPRLTLTYSDNAILPPFQQCLPEMDLSLFPTAIWKLVQPDEMGMLWASGQNRLGRLRFTEPGQPLGQAAGLRLGPGEFSKIEDGEAFFFEAIARLTSIPGVAGVQPKTLVNLDQLEGAAATIDTHILKACKADYPWVTVIESLSLQAAQKCGLDAAGHQLSGDGRLIAVERFDLDSTGNPIGFDELCALSGKLSFEKYDGSYESLIKTARSFLPASKRHAELLKLFRQLAFNYAIENGDAHWKNFGLVYEDPDNARLSPAYDVLTTTCFPTLVHDAPALTLNGRKVWDGAFAELRRVGASLCLLGAAQMKEVFDQIGDGLLGMAKAISEAKAAYPDAAEYIDRMKGAWDRGCLRLIQDSKPKKKSSAAGDLTRK
jgi:serine/threonine-protein kinase HipA